jgi:hypothetical protein
VGREGSKSPSSAWEKARALHLIWGRFEVLKCTLDKGIWSFPQLSACV